ncbi:SRPBCC family protein [Sphingobacterium sp. SRCM116780]|uniref:SRPBCC family protein n=1 Tax=Sphingobacterium sp. SRCM116780 TaxID=2907623 RepID=UPI001F3EFEDF|nr:SRPBCC domain-containing protein [Sphingobacterium sp. SRCM116780]UIR54996.1 SRPBCC family protein [Sphingobacterium sp. SRCM116780]
MENKLYVEAQMLIRKPASEVFQAFIDPEITIHFWFTKSSGKLELGKTSIWEWEMYGVKSPATVQDIIPNEKIVVLWGEPATEVEFNFKSLSPESTYVVIKQKGFSESGDELTKILMDSTGGFTTVLDGCKAYLEHGINLNLIADKFPKEVLS